RSLGNHRQVNGDAIAFPDAARLQHIGEAAYFGVQLLVGKLFVVLRIVALPQDGRLVAALGKMAVDAVVADVQRAVLEPFDRHVAGVVGGVLDLAERLDPVEALGLLTPETVRILDRAHVHFLVLGFVHVGAFPPIGRNVIDLVRHRASSRPTHYAEGALFVSAFWPYYATVPARPTRRGLPLLSRYSRPLRAPPTDYGADDDKGTEPADAVDDREHEATALKSVVGRDRGQHKAEPAEEGRDNAGAQRKRIQVQEDAVEHPGNDDLADKYNDERGTL